MSQNARTPVPAATSGERGEAELDEKSDTKGRRHRRASVSLTEKTVENHRKYGIKTSAKYCSERVEKNRPGLSRAKHSV